MLRWILFLFMGIPTLTVSAETVYINDNLFVGVRTEANSREEPLKVLKTGAKLTLLEKAKSFYRVRTEEGIEGWVNKLYVSEEPPAKIQIVTLQNEFDRVNETLNSVKLTNEKMLKEKQQMVQRITDLENENNRVVTELAELQNKETSFWTLYRDHITFGALLVLFVLGIVLGIRWHKNYVAKRLGGLQI